jgi:hypothetical protein
VDVLRAVVRAPVQAFIWFEQRAEAQAIDENQRTAGKIATPYLNALFVQAADSAELPANHPIRQYGRELIQTAGQCELIEMAARAAATVTPYDDGNGPLHELLLICQAIADQDPTRIITVARRECRDVPGVYSKLSEGLNKDYHYVIQRNEGYCFCQEAWAIAERALADDINNPTFQKAAALCCFATQRNRPSGLEYCGPTAKQVIGQRIKASLEQAKAERQRELEIQLRPQAFEGLRRRRIYLATTRREVLHRIDDAFANLHNKPEGLDQAIKAIVLARDHEERLYWLGVAWCMTRSIQGSNSDELLTAIEEAQIEYSSDAEFDLDLSSGKNPALPEDFQTLIGQAIGSIQPPQAGNINIIDAGINEVVDLLNRALDAATPLNGYSYAVAAHHLLKSRAGAENNLELILAAAKCIPLGSQWTLDCCFDKVAAAMAQCDKSPPDHLSPNQKWLDLVGDVMTCKKLLSKVQASDNPRNTIRLLAVAEWHASRALGIIDHERKYYCEITLPSHRSPYPDSIIEFDVFTSESFTRLNELKNSITNCLIENAPFADKEILPEVKGLIRQAVAEWNQDLALSEDPFEHRLDRIIKSMLGLKNTIDLQRAIACALFCVDQLESSDPKIAGLRKALGQIEEKLKFRMDERLRAEVDRIAEISLRETLTQNWKTLIAWGVLGFFALHSPWHNRPRVVIAIGMGAAIFSAWRPEIDDVLHMTTQWAEELTKKLMGHRYQDKLLLGSLLLFPTMWAVVKTPVIGRFIQAIAGFGVAAMTGNLLWRVQRRGYKETNPIVQRKQLKEWTIADYLSARRWGQLVSGGLLEHNDIIETTDDWSKFDYLKPRRWVQFFNTLTEINESLAVGDEKTKEDREKVELAVAVASTVASVAKLALFGGIGLTYCMTTNAHSFIAWLAGAAVISASSEIISEITENPVAKAVGGAIDAIGIAGAVVIGSIAAIGFIPGYYLGKLANGPLNIDLRKLCGPAETVWFWNNLIAATVGIAVGTALWEVEAALFGFRKKKRQEDRDTPTLDPVRRWISEKVPHFSLDLVRQQLNQIPVGPPFDPIRRRLDVWVGR